MSLVLFLILVWVPFAAVMVAEHYVLTRIYGKQSSLQRIFNQPSESARTDLSVWSVYYFAIPALKAAGRSFVPMLGIVTSLVALPGIAYLLAKFIAAHWTWHGFFRDALPTAGLWGFLFWLLAHDLALYVAHVLMHRVPWLWRFHRLHHAATEMNVVTGSRVSLGEHGINELSIFLLLNVIIGIPQPEMIFFVMLCRRVIDLIQHSDLPFDYGWLGYVIASPRFHRMHHSSEPSDHDANYGNIFTFWDYLFGTVAPRYRESPALADACPLGLDSATETRQVNGNWVTAALQGTLYEDWHTLRSKKTAPAGDGETVSARASEAR